MEYNNLNGKNEGGLKMSFIKNLKIERYRGLENLEFKNFKKINLFIGENNTGKTSILEVLNILSEPFNPASIIQTSRIREKDFNLSSGSLSPYESFINIFNQKINDKKIAFSAEVKDKNIFIKLTGKETDIINVQPRYGISENYSVNNKPEKGKLFKGMFTFDDSNSSFEKEFTLAQDQSRIELNSEIDQDKLLNINYISPLEHLAHSKLISQAIKTGNKKSLIKIMKIFDNKIISLDIIDENGRPIPYIEHQKLGIVPLSTFGDGLKKALIIAANIVNVKDGVLLIDEIETSIHKKALLEFFQWYIKGSFQYNVQSFIATHSLEAIDALINASKEQLNNIACYRLEKDTENIYINRISGKKLYDIRHSLGQDVR
ncbi:MAG: ATPase AAA [Halanaerobium sp.]|nr:MAG: ATPase AAA [Halanaerobium sp.]